MSVIQSYLCTLITSKGTNINQNIANQNHASRTPKPGYLRLTSHYYVSWVRDLLIIYRFVSELQKSLNNQVTVNLW
jgi:hypothetical protein